MKLLKLVIIMLLVLTSPRSIEGKTLIGTIDVSKAQGKPCPLVLFSEPSQEGEGAFSESGFMSYLLGEGYTMGENLFAFVPSEPYQDLSSGAFMVRNFLGDVASRLRKAQVLPEKDHPSQREDMKIDVISFGVSGLVLRYALETGYIQDGIIRNLIMLDTPNKGTFLAGFLKSFSEIAKSESSWEKETRAARFSPIGKIHIPSGLGLSKEKDLLTLAGNPFHVLKQWESETAWISKRASTVYEPLYALYVKDRHLSIPYVPLDSAQETFFGWVKRSYPTFWDIWIKRSSLPVSIVARGMVNDGDTLSRFSAPDESRQGSGQDLGSPETQDEISRVSPLDDLTLAYYETLSMEVARNQYVVKTASKENLLDTVLNEKYIPISWKDALRHYGLRILAHYAGKALATLKTSIQNKLAQKLVEEIGFGKDPDSAFLRRLINEDVFLNLGSFSEGRFERVPANHYLKVFNRLSLGKWEKRTTRYVLISGKVSNIWSLAWPQVGPNNWFCEVDSAVAACGPKDLVRVFSGMLSPSHLTLLKDSQVRAFIKEILLGREFPPEISAVQGKLPISSWRPSYVRVLPEKATAGLEISLPPAPEGWSYCVWTEELSQVSRDDLVSPSDWTIVKGSSRMVQEGTVFTVLEEPAIRRIGIRLMRQAPGSVQGGSLVQSSFEKEISSAVMYAVTDRLPIGSEENGEGSGYHNSEGEATIPKGPFLEEIPEGVSQTPKSPWDHIPEIRVVYRSKRITHKKPFETYHVKWVLDYGDGQKGEVIGNPLLKVSHFYSKPGSYQSSIVSYDNHGEVIFEKRVKVEINDGKGENVEFQAQSIPRLDVELRLSGPRMWMTGKPALYEAEVLFQEPSGAKVGEISIDPGPKFKIVWERAGDFVVSFSATVSIEFDLEGKRVSVENTYLTEIPCKVLTGSMTR